MKFHFQDYFKIIKLQFSELSAMRRMTIWQLFDRRTPPNSINVNEITPWQPPNGKRWFHCFKFKGLAECSGTPCIFSYAEFPPSSAAFFRIYIFS